MPARMRFPESSATVLPKVFAPDRVTLGPFAEETPVATRKGFARTHRQAPNACTIDIKMATLFPGRWSNFPVVRRVGPPVSSEPELSQGKDRTCS